MMLARILFAALLALALPVEAGLKAVAASGAATLTPGTTTVSSCADASVLFVHPANTLATCDANFTYTGTPLLTVGSGSTTSVGVQTGYSGTSGVSGLWSTGVTVGTTSSMIKQNGALTTVGRSDVGGTQVEIATASGQSIWRFSSAGHLITPTTNTFDIGASGATSPRNLYLASSIKQVGGVTTTGTTGVSATVASANATAQSAANASVATFTVGAADADFEVGGQVNVTVVTTLATSMFCSYTDVSNTPRTMILPVQQLTGSFIAAGAITGLGSWESPRMHIRAKAATAITCGTSAGTFTGVTYSASFVITELN